MTNCSIDFNCIQPKLLSLDLDNLVILRALSNKTQHTTNICCETSTLNFLYTLALVNYVQNIGFRSWITLSYPSDSKQILQTNWLNETA